MATIKSGIFIFSACYVKEYKLLILGGTKVVDVSNNTKRCIPIVLATTCTFAYDEINVATYANMKMYEFGFSVTYGNPTSAWTKVSGIVWTGQRLIVGISYYISNDSTSEGNHPTSNGLHIYDIYVSNITAWATFSGWMSSYLNISVGTSAGVGNFISGSDKPYIDGKQSTTDYMLVLSNIIPGGTHYHQFRYICISKAHGNGTITNSSYNQSSILICATVYRTNGNAMVTLNCNAPGYTTQPPAIFYITDSYEIAQMTVKFYTTKPPEQTIYKQPISPYLGVAPKKILSFSVINSEYGYALLTGIVDSTAAGYSYFTMTILNLKQGKFAAACIKYPEIAASPYYSTEPFTDAEYVSAQAIVSGPLYAPDVLGGQSSGPTFNYLIAAKQLSGEIHGYLGIPNDDSGDQGTLYQFEFSETGSTPVRYHHTIHSNIVHVNNTIEIHGFVPLLKDDNSMDFCFGYGFIQCTSKKTGALGTWPTLRKFAYRPSYGYSPIQEGPATVINNKYLMGFKTFPPAFNDISERVAEDFHNPGLQHNAPDNKIRVIEKDSKGRHNGIKFKVFDQSSSDQPIANDINNPNSR